MSGKNNTALHPFTLAQSKFMEEHYSLLEWFLSFGKSYGNIYYFTNCGAYVGVHDGTKKPLGTLANAALRNKRGISLAGKKDEAAGLPHPHRPVHHSPVPGGH